MSGGREVYAPFALWVYENKNRFSRKMPLTEFLGTWPAWLLRDVIHSESTSNPELCPAVFMAVYHLRMWAEKVGPIELPLDPDRVRELIRHVAQIEAQRRFGIIRYWVEDPDRLVDGGTLTIELNPAVMEILRPPFPPEDDPAWDEQVARALVAAANSGWADLSALEDFTELASLAPWWGTT